MPAKNQELDGMVGEGVEILVIPELDKVINKYERKKEARCAESPGEIAAKKELKETLHNMRDRLPVNDEGNKFYRKDEKDYVLAEKLAIKNVPELEEED